MDMAIFVFRWPYGIIFLRAASAFLVIILIEMWTLYSRRPRD